MTKPTFVFVVNGGALRAYREEETSPGKTALHLVQAIEFTDAHARYSERFSDQAGGFPSGRGGGANAIAERLGIENETVARLVRMISDEIIQLLNKEQPERWCLAAPPEINHVVVDHVAARTREKPFRNLPLDLVKLSPHDVLERFQST